MTAQTSNAHPRATDGSIETSAADNDGYSRGLGNRQIQMIAIGGAIGTGLFLGAGSRLQAAGPALAIAYLVAGFFAFLIVRALGELAMYKPTCGSFVVYTREFLGDRASYVAGWLSFFAWSMSGIVDITAVGLYMHFWGVLQGVPPWIFGACALAFVTLMNLIGVKYFGELEYWFSMIKVGALSLFLILGAVILIFGLHVHHQSTGLHLIADHGGFFPHGYLIALTLIQGVVFAYSGIETIGTAAGESEEPRKIIPKAFNSVIWRIVLFYFGSVMMLVCLLPWSAYSGGVSPFVTFFEALGLPHADSAMNLVVVTASISSLNTGLYSTSRVLRAMALDRSAPRFLGHLNASATPSRGILLMVAFYAVGVGIDYFVPERAFEFVLNASTLGIVTTWAFIVASQIAYRRGVKAGRYPKSAYPMPGAPFSAWATLVFLAGVLVFMAFDFPEGTSAIIAIPFVLLLLYLGRKLLRRGEVSPG